MKLFARALFSCLYDMGKGALVIALLVAIIYIASTYPAATFISLAVIVFFICVIARMNRLDDEDKVKQHRKTHHGE